MSTWPSSLLAVPDFGAAVTLLLTHKISYMYILGDIYNRMAGIHAAS
jgi:hypothetical protein